MTQSQIITTFLGNIRTCLDSNHIERIYYGLSYWEQTDHYVEFMNFQHKELLQHYLKRYHERVFCYELYHKLRILMDLEKDEQGNPLYQTKGIFLQSEVKKTEIHEYVERVFKVTRLSGDFMPDFLLHTPGNFENQLVVIEAKSNPNLSFDMLKADLLKIQEFINNYKYRKGIFIAVNISDEKRNTLVGELSQWHNQNLNTPAQISIIFKNRPETELFEFTLNNIPVIW